MTAPSDFKKQLAAWMVRFDLRQEEAAELLGVTQPTISLWLAGKTRPHAVVCEALLTKIQNLKPAKQAA